MVYDLGLFINHSYNEYIIVIGIREAKVNAFLTFEKLFHK